jgi:hypothetical protein
MRMNIAAKSDLDHPKAQKAKMAIINEDGDGKCREEPAESPGVRWAAYNTGAPVEKEG